MNQYESIYYKDVLFASMLWMPNRQKDPAKLLSVKAVLTLNSSASSVNLKVIGSESSVSCTRSYILNQGPGLGQDYLNVREPHLRILMNFDVSWSYINESVINSVQIECEVGSAICWWFICISNFSSKPLLVMCCFDRACTMRRHSSDSDGHSYSAPVCPCQELIVQLRKDALAVSDQSIYHHPAMLCWLEHTLTIHNTLQRRTSLFRRSKCFVYLAS